MTQGWIGPTRADAQNDLCSHGDVRVVIGRCVVAPGDGERDYTISTSALALLRILESDHSAEEPVADSLVLCCGMLSLISCPIGIDWSVSHLGGRVRLHDVVRCDDTVGELRFPELEVELGEDAYRRQVVAFAANPKHLFEGVEKRSTTTLIDSCVKSSGRSTTDDSAVRADRAAAPQDRGQLKRERALIALL